MSLIPILIATGTIPVGKRKSSNPENEDIDEVLDDEDYEEEGRDY